jgi:hypothetical protein
MNGKKKTTTTPKGYRLKPSTHKFIKAVQKEFRLSQEKVISEAVSLFYNHAKEISQGRI